MRNCWGNTPEELDFTVGTIPCARPDSDPLWPSQLRRQALYVGRIVCEKIYRVFYFSGACVKKMLKKSEKMRRKCSNANI